MGEARRKKLAQAAGAATPAETLDEQVRTALSRYKPQRTGLHAVADGKSVPLFRYGALLFVRTVDVAPDEVSESDQIRPWTRADGSPVTLHEVRAQLRAAQRGAA